MIKLGILDFDTSHVVEFTKRLNHKDIDKEQWVDGAEVVVACPGESKIMPERIPEYTKAMKNLGVPLVEKPGDMIDKVEGMLIEAQEGGVHWDRARPFLDAGIPCFVDKPFACSVDDARKMVELAAKKNTTIFSSSSLRYSPEIVSFMESAHGKIHGAFVYTPASLHERNPGFFHYGIHGVEILYTIMGPGCKRVTCTHEKDADVITGQWKDGRLATVRGIRAGKHDYGCMVFSDDKKDDKKSGIIKLDLPATFIYRELLKKIVEMFDKKKSPVEPEETVEIVSFIEAAYKSGNNHGAGESLDP
jgi:virulence factor